VASNLHFLENVIRHPLFVSGECTTRFIDDTPELFRFSARRDRATRLLRFVGDVVVNGTPEMKGRKKPEHVLTPALKPKRGGSGDIPAGTRDRLKTLGPTGFAQWLRANPQVMLTDTSMRDAHQSLFATRMRTRDMIDIAPYYARLLPNLLSMECWGGATFDVALRFLKEDPWERLAQLRERVPNIPFQMLLRSANAVGYTNYPDNVVKYFIQQAAQAGVDIFRVFDSLNWVDNMRVAMDGVIESGGVCEAAICYTGDIFDAARPKFDLKYYVTMAKQLEKAGAHILGIKDMAGVCRPRAVSALVKALREETGLPIHFHTHDTSGIAAASVLAAIDAGVDAVDGALDALSGLTSQPNLTSIADALRGTERAPDLDTDAMRELSDYWEGVRRFYVPFEADIRAGTSDVYHHEMPGGQYTNLREQARGMGLEHRWPEVSRAYAEVNRMFGDIVKVTPTSKVVGDLALFMVANDLTPADVEDPTRDVAFPESVVSLFKGELGRPPEGFPEALSNKILQGRKPLVERPGKGLAPVDLEAERAKAAKAIGRHLSDSDLASWLMYPKVFTEYAAHHRHYGDVSQLPTPVFFNGLAQGEEIAVAIDAGKTLVIRLQGSAEITDDDGDAKKLFFELNGQPRLVRIDKAGVASTRRERPKAEDGNPDHIGAPMPGTVVTVSVKPGQKVRRGDPLVSIEAMKMETVVRAERDAVVAEVHATPGMAVAPKDLLVKISG
jgi:pyruvate carboxylase